MRFKISIYTIIISFFFICIGFNSAMAQNFNIDFGDACGTPAPTYGAGGQVGLWNSVTSIGVSPLTSITGVATPATVNVTATQYGGSCTDCSSPVNALISDYFYISPTGTWSVIFNNLTDGNYTVFIYAPSPASIPTGSMSVNGVSVASILGNNCNLISGTSYVAVPATITGGTLTITGTSSAPEDGLSGIQLQTSSASIPTMTQWGMIIFVVLAGLGAAYYIRRQKTAKS